MNIHWYKTDDCNLSHHHHKMSDSESGEFNLPFFSVYEMVCKFFLERKRSLKLLTVNLELFHKKNVLGWGVGGTFHNDHYPS